MGPETIASVGVSLATAAAGVWAARAARRTPRQERRDDFTALTTQQGNAIKRLEARVQRQEEDSERQRKRIGDQDATIGYLLNRVRGLAAFIRASKLEPPPAEPMPDRVRAYIQHIDV